MSARQQPPEQAETPSRAPAGFAGDHELRLRRLTPRQKDCLRLVAPDYHSKSIARDLGISALRVDKHIGDARRILGVSSRFEGARLLRAWEQQHADRTGTHHWGAPSSGLLPGSRPLPDRETDNAAAGSKADVAEATPGSRETARVEGAGSPHAGARTWRSQNDEQERAPPFAAALSVLAILAAIGAVASLLFVFDWIGQG
jgi:DNA-binding CsgD family transcriptional regulator